jgi:hypothetical protein
LSIHISLVAVALISGLDAFLELRRILRPAGDADLPIAGRLA